MTRLVSVVLLTLLMARRFPVNGLLGVASRCSPVAGVPSDAVPDPWMVMFERDTVIVLVMGQNPPSGLGWRVQLAGVVQSVGAVRQLFQLSQIACTFEMGGGVVVRNAAPAVGS